jgi:hypothetical protein
LADKNESKTNTFLAKLLPKRSQALFFFFDVGITAALTAQTSELLQFVTNLYTTMAKTRIGVVFRESMGGVKSHNQSADLVALTERYHAFVKKLHVLIISLQQHHAVMIQIDKTRTQVRYSGSICALTIR